MTYWIQICSYNIHADKLYSLYVQLSTNKYTYFRQIVCFTDWQLESWKWSAIGGMINFGNRRWFRRLELWWKTLSIESCGVFGLKQIYFTKNLFFLNIRDHITGFIGKIKETMPMCCDVLITLKNYMFSFLKWILISCFKTFEIGVGVINKSAIVKLTIAKIICLFVICRY
jgi:hypothetical protein